MYACISVFSNGNAFTAGSSFKGAESAKAVLIIKKSYPSMTQDVELSLLKFFNESKDPVAQATEVMEGIKASFETIADDVNATFEEYVRLSIKAMLEEARKPEDKAEPSGLAKLWAFIVKHRKEILVTGFAVFGMAFSAPIASVIGLIILLVDDFFNK